ncbi:hypothetical protein HDV01_001333 [Terramyces sp. JEL0728]|nr:hypothetical protein HDV01_001333 [Terramyces sp. JEL0728]
MSDQEEITTDGAAAFHNPAAISTLQSRMASMIGQSSGYIATLPQDVRNRINALKNISKKNQDIEYQFEKELLELEKKYLALHQPIYDQRHLIITGGYEPTEEECQRTEEEQDDLPPAPEGAEPQTGIPQFWLTVLLNVPGIADTITEEDQEALKHLVDIRTSYLEGNPGFQLEFVFTENEFFTNKVLYKKYFLEEPDNNYDHAEGTTVNWKDDKDLSVRVEVKKQRHKATNKTRTVKKTVPVDTFFNFFKPPKVPEDEEEAEDIDFSSFEMDYDMGEMIKEKVIPDAVNWFTGEALEEYNEEEDDEGYDEFDDDDEIDDDDDDEDGAPAGNVDKAPECKQQ